jgi:phage/plasmid-associated DNA primase
MLLATFDKTINKAPLNTPEANTGYTNRDLSRVELAQSVHQGRALSGQLKGPRKTENFLATGFAGLDFDHDFTVEEALANPFIQHSACLIYTTPSHRKEGNGDRFRVIFELIEALYDAGAYRCLILGLLEKFPQADPSAKDPARIWYGSTNCEQHILDGLLDRQTMDELIAKGKAIEAEKAITQKECSYELPIEEAAKMLTFIDPQPGYEIWRNICFALGNAYGEDAIDLVEAWSPDEKHNGRHLRQIIQRADGRTTLGTVIYQAMQGGYLPPKEFVNLKRTPEQVAFEDIFDRGQDYIAIGKDLYKYNGTHYKKLEWGYCEKLIADYFYTYPTDLRGKKGFASDKKIQDALKFVVAKLYVDPALVNPSGLNLRNGTLKLSFQGKKPVWNLMPHTPTQYYTYAADFDYNPNADTNLVQKVLNDILDPPQLTVFMRTISAIFDLPTVRRLQGRAVKALILLGVGSNGKDTLRVWTELLVGEYGLTTVGLRDFVSADNSRRFALHSLAASLINWSSESDVIALDKCQSLKNFVTGDPVTIEKKHKDDVVIKPKAVGIFNANEAPHISSAKEAIASRYAFLEFPNKFVLEPRTDFHREKQGNPRYKEDPGFIKSEILPGYLLLLMQAFADLCREGIDIRCTEEAIESVRLDSNHFYQFMQETQMVSCPLVEGLTASDVQFRYETWCRENGLLAGFADDHKVWNDPSKYDPLVKNVRDMTKRLKSEIPDLMIGRNNTGRKIGVKFLTGLTFKSIGAKATPVED